MRAAIPPARALVLALGPLSLCACSTTAVQSTVPAAAPTAMPSGRAAGYHYECNAPRGHTVSWSKRVSGKAVAISGMIAVRRFRHDPVWEPTADISAILGNREAITLRIEDLSARTLGVLLINSTEPRAEHIVGTLPIYPRPLHFSLEVTSDSLLHVAVGELRASERLDRGQPTGVQLACSTADLYYSNVVISRR